MCVVTEHSFGCIFVTEQVARRRCQRLRLPRRLYIPFEWCVALSFNHFSLPKRLCVRVFWAMVEWVVHARIEYSHPQRTCNTHNPFVWGTYVPSVQRVSIRYGEQKIAQFRTHYLTNELACVSTQPSGQDTMDTKMI